MNEKIEKSIKNLYSMSSPCVLCPHKCRVDRRNGEYGRCGVFYNPIVASHPVHFGEEPVISGKNGSGTIFFVGCTMSCVYCQNFLISQRQKLHKGKEKKIEELCEIMLEFQKNGVHNVNLVTPSHFIPHIVDAIILARKKGLKIPIVYNTSGYESVEMLKNLRGIVDIYLTDLRYSSNDNAFEYSHIKNYVEFSRNALMEMVSQAGDKLQLNNDRTALKGIIIRLLILPNDVAGIEETLKFIKNNIGVNITISLMSQYYPTHNAKKHHLIGRKIYYGEYLRAISLLEKFGFENSYIQGMDSPEFYLPDFFREENPFSE